MLAKDLDAVGAILGGLLGGTKGALAGILVGGGGTIGMLSDVTDRWKLMLSGTYLRYALGDKSEDLRWFVGSRYTLSRDWALRVEYNHRDRDNDVVFSVQAFF